MAEYKSFINNMINCLDKNGHTSTKGWDLMYSIRSTRLNALLQKKYDSNKLAKYINFNSTDRISDHLSSIKEFHIHLASPVISFVGDNVHVDMKIIAPSNFTYTILYSCLFALHKKRTL